MVPGGNHLVLASRSPQRRAILEALGVEFVVRAPLFVETERGDAERVAREDALAALGGRLYGKPGDLRAARETLRALSGAHHTVVSGLALLGLEDSPRL